MAKNKGTNFFSFDEKYVDNKLFNISGGIKFLNDFNRMSTCRGLFYA